MRVPFSLVVLAGLLALVHATEEVASLDSVAGAPGDTGVSTKALLNSGKEASEGAAAEKGAEDAKAFDSDEADDVSVAGVGGCQCMSRAELVQHDKENGIRRVAASIAAPVKAKKKEPCAEGKTTDPAKALAKMANGEVEGEATKKSGDSLDQVDAEATAKADQEQAAAETQMAAAKIAVEKAAVDKADAHRVHEQAVAAHKSSASNLVAVAQAAVDKAAEHKAAATKNHQDKLDALAVAKKKAAEVTPTASPKDDDKPPSTEDGTKPGSGAEALAIATSYSSTAADGVGNSTTTKVKVKKDNVSKKDADPIAGMDSKTASDYISLQKATEKEDKAKKATTAEPAEAVELLQEDERKEAQVDADQSEKTDKKVIQFKTASGSYSSAVTTLSNEADEPAAKCVCKPGTGPTVTKVDPTQDMDSKTAANYIDFAKPKVATDAEKGKGGDGSEAATEAEAGGDLD